MLGPFESMETKRETWRVMRTRRGHQEKASAAPRKKSGWWWPYTRCSVSGVMLRYPAASQRGTPRCISQVAHVCRRTCGVTSSRFARSHAEEKPLLISFNLPPFSFMTNPRSEPREQRARRRCPSSLAVAADCSPIYNILDDELAPRRSRPQAPLGSDHSRHCGSFPHRRG
jgi:hypothetical protein